MKAIRKAAADKFNPQRISFCRDIAFFIERKFQQCQARTIQHDYSAAAAATGSDIFDVGLAQIRHAAERVFKFYELQATAV